MSKIVPRAMKCAVCGASSDQFAVMSCYSPTAWLDGRRVHAPTGVMECPHCHYTAWTIEGETKEAIKNYVLGNEYEKWRNDYSGPDFLKAIEQAVQIESHKDIPDTAHYYLAAAWKCDDKKEKELAKEYRKKYLEACRQSIVYQPYELIRYVDALRRVEQFEEAEKLAEELIPGLAQGNQPLLKIATYQVELCKKKDSAGHFLSEIPDFDTQ